MNEAHDLTDNERELIATGTALTLQRDELTKRVETLTAEKDELIAAHARSEEAWRAAGNGTEEKVKAAEERVLRYSRFHRLMCDRLTPVVDSWISMMEVFKDEDLTDSGKERVAAMKRLKKAMELDIG